MTRNVLALAAAAAALLAAVPAQAESVCVEDPAVSAVYEGCTIVYFEEGHHCITGGGTVLGSAYRLSPCR